MDAYTVGYNLSSFKMLFKHKIYKNQKKFENQNFKLKLQSPKFYEFYTFCLNEKYRRARLIEPTLISAGESGARFLFNWGNFL